MSSSAGYLGHLGARSGDKAKAEEIKKTLASPDLSVEDLDKLMKNFVETAEAGNHSDHGWPNSTYVVSKIGWSALSRIQQRMMDEDPREDIVVNHVHPGYVDTDMTSHKGLSLKNPIDKTAARFFFPCLPFNPTVRHRYGDGQNVEKG